MAICVSRALMVKLEKVLYKMLLEATKHGDTETINNLLGIGDYNDCVTQIDITIDRNVQDDGGWTLLHWSVWMRQHLVVALLIESGALVNLKDKQDRTPLRLAGDEEMRSYLLQHGATT